MDMRFKTAVLVASALLWGTGHAWAAAAKTAGSTAAARHAASLKKQPGQKTLHRRHRSHGYRTTAGFVPPPPAYMPSILPDIAARRGQGYYDNADATAAEQPDNHYSKYIYEREGEAPSALQERKGVVTWSRRN